MMVILAVVVASLFVALLGLSQVQNMRNQQVAFEGFRYELANGTAPVYAADQNSKLLAPGTPVALLKIPRIGVSAVVVEGTTSDITMLGPGHRRDTVLPGQEGVSVVYGRQFTYGAVFSQLSELKAGDKITVTTGQGESRFTVDGVRYDDDPLPDPPAPGEGRLTLVSATGGIPLVPTGIVRVDATMVDDAYLAPLTEFTYAALGAEEEAMKGEGRAWPLLALSLVALVVLVVVFSLLRRFWGRWQTWIVAVPVFVATGTFAATQIAILFPNVI
jgi:sortase (surface protein transpeptidase)